MARRRKTSRRKPLKVRSNGKLRKAAGVKRGGMTRSKARQMKRSRSKATRKRANFYLNVLSKPKRKRKGGKKRR